MIGREDLYNLNSLDADRGCLCDWKRFVMAGSAMIGAVLFGIGYFNKDDNARTELYYGSAVSAVVMVSTGVLKIVSDVMASRETRVAETAVGLSLRPEIQI